MLEQHKSLLVIKHATINNEARMKSQSLAIFVFFTSTLSYSTAVYPFGNDLKVVMEQCDNGKNCVEYARFKSRPVCEQFVNLLQIQASQEFFRDLNRNGFATAYKALRMYQYQCKGD
ncbi:hypothetical protein [Oligoflexus tunisiensis]|uniref:hypothetical protein n=1 Tax=Oligoflexus tunisiensis TaxID=708132 RepID=UPI001C4047EB|nr:hypothetical protein [Oligoflexus tunisiensis]